MKYVPTPGDAAHQLSWCNAALWYDPNIRGQKVKKQQKAIPYDDRWQILQYSAENYSTSLTVARVNSSTSTNLPAPLHLWQCQPLDSRSPIDELFIALHPPSGPYASSISLVVFAKAGVSEQLHQSLLEETEGRWSYRMSDSESCDSRFRAEFYAECHRSNASSNFGSMPELHAFKYSPSLIDDPLSNITLLPKVFAVAVDAPEKAARINSLSNGVTVSDGFTQESFDFFNSLEKIFSFINGLKKISPFSEELINHINNVISAAKKIKNQLPRNIERDTKWQSIQQYPCKKEKELSLFRSTQEQAKTSQLQRYSQREDNFPAGYPPLHQAVITNDLAFATEALTNDPFSVFDKDPWGNTASQLAERLNRLIKFEDNIELLKIRSLLISFETELPAPCSRNILRLLQRKRQLKIDRFFSTFTTDTMKTFQSRRLLYSIESTIRNENLNITVEQYVTALQEYNHRRSTENHSIFMYAMMLLGFNYGIGNTESIFNKNKPERSKLHQASINDDLKMLCKELDVNPQRINEQDPWGYTPLIIALAKGYARIVKELLKRGASLEPVYWDQDPEPFHWDKEPIAIYDPVHNAATAEVLELILRRRDLNPLQFTEKLHEAVEELNFPMVFLLLRYGLRANRNSRGHSALDNAFLAAAQGKSEIFSLMLQFHNKLLPYGEYSASISDFVIKIIQNHNQRVTDLLQSGAPYETSEFLDNHYRQVFQHLHPQAGSRIKVIDCEQDQTNGWIITKLNNPYLQQPLSACIKPIAELTKDELKDIYVLAKDTFKVLDDKFSLQDYLDKMFNKSETGFIEVCTLKGKVISFSIFEILSGYLPNTGNFKTLHVNLAAAHPRFSSCGITSLVTRLGIALKLLFPKKKVMVYCKAIPPGYAWLVLPINICQPWPMYNEDPMLVLHIVKSTGETLRKDGLLTSKLSVARKPISSGKTLNYTFFSRDQIDAIPTLWEINKKTAAGYYKTRLEPLGVTKPQIQQTAIMLESLMKTPTFTPRPRL